MMLLALTSQPLYDSYMAFVESFRSSKYFFITPFQAWINGKKITATGWASYIPQETPLYSGAVWSFNNPGAGTHLTAVKSSGFNPTVEGKDGASNSFWFWCQYD